MDFFYSNQIGGKNQSRQSKKNLNLSVKNMNPSEKLTAPNVSEMIRAGYMAHSVIDKIHCVYRNASVTEIINKMKEDKKEVIQTYEYNSMNLKKYH